MPWLVPSEQIVHETLASFLVHIQQILPEGADRARELIAHGSAPAHVGEVVAGAIQDRLGQEIENVRAAEAGKRSGLSDEINDLKHQLADAQRKDAEVNELCKKAETNEKAILGLQEKIAIQNRLLVQQHEQIMNLCGVQDDHAHP